MSSVYLASPDFRDNLNQWLSRGSNISLETIAKNRQQLPIQFRNYTRRLYLAVTIDDEFIDAATFGRASLKSHTVWAKDELKARSHFRNKSTQDGKYNILISKTIEMRHIILDLDEFATFMGVPQLKLLGFEVGGLEVAKEKKHVIVAKDVLINRSDYTILSQNTQQGRQQ